MGLEKRLLLHGEFVDREAVFNHVILIQLLGQSGNGRGQDTQRPLGDLHVVPLPLHEHFLIEAINDRLHGLGHALGEKTCLQLLGVSII